MTSPLHKALEGAIETAIDRNYETVMAANLTDKEKLDLVLTMLASTLGAAGAAYQNYNPRCKDMSRGDIVQMLMDEIGQMFEARYAAKH